MSLSSSTSTSGGFKATNIQGFPESFQRTTPPDVDDTTGSDNSRSPSPLLGMSSLTFPPISPYSRPSDLYSESSSTRRISRSHVMRLENILNDVPMNYTPASRSRSLGRSPVQRHTELYELSSPISPVSSIGRSQSPEEGCVVKKKKVKMHKCPACQKEFPRPSGLRTHMNMHTKEKPYGCAYPGCTRFFSVVSNAKRHMRTHGIGVSADDNDTSSVPYVVGFEEPVVIAQPEIEINSVGKNQPFRLRWISLGSETRMSMGKE